MSARPFCTAIVVGGGSGKRMGGTQNKIFLDLNGMPVLAHTLLVFENCPLIDEIVLVGRKEEHRQCLEIAEQFRISKLVTVVSGGIQRRDSVWNGLQAANSQTKLAAVHDAARPFVSQDALAAVIETAARTKAATLGVRAKDTIKVCDRDNTVVSTPSRENLWLIQTPQVFDYNLICRAHRTITTPVTDDCALVEALGVSITVVEGGYTNIKLTTPEDIVYAGALLQAGIL